MIRRVTRHAVAVMGGVPIRERAATRIAGFPDPVPTREIVTRVATGRAPPTRAPEERTPPSQDPRGGPPRGIPGPRYRPDRIGPPPAITQPPPPPDPVGDPPTAFNGEEQMPIRRGPGFGEGPGFGSGGFPGFRNDPFGPIIEQGGSYCREIGIPDWLCATGEAVVGGIFDRGGQEGSSSPGTQLVPSCPDGFRWNPNSGQCETTGVRGGIERFLPGGREGTLADFQGEAVVGAFGIPGMMPQVVGQRMDARGEVNPILQCPTGLVLGKDNVCYMKGAIGRRFRKWPPRKKPPVSAADAAAIRQADRAKNRVKKLAQKSGFSCRKR